VSSNPLKHRCSDCKKNPATVQCVNCLHGFCAVCIDDHDPCPELNPKKKFKSSKVVESEDSDDGTDDDEGTDEEDMVVTTCSKRSFECSVLVRLLELERDVPFDDAQSLLKAFTGFCELDDDEYGLLLKWTQFAFWGFQLLRMRMLDFIVTFTKNDPNWVNQKNAWTALMRWTPGPVVEWVAFFVLLRRLFVARVPKRGSSVHLDFQMVTPIGTMYVRNSYDSKKKGTTRIWFFDANKSVICDPSYPDLRKAFDALEKKKSGNGQALARLILHLVQPSSIGSGTLYTKLSKSDLQFADLEINLPVKTLTDNTKVDSIDPKYSVGEGFTETGAGAVIRVGDLAAAAFGILFIAEGRHALMVTEANMQLLRLAARGMVRLVDCLQTIEGSFSGTLFPSANFRPYGGPEKWQHSLRFPLLNILGELHRDLFTTAFEDDFEAEIEEDIGSSLGQIFSSGEAPTIGKKGDPIKPKELSTAALSPLYKIAFIQFMIHCLFPEKWEIPLRYRLGSTDTVEKELKAYFARLAKQRNVQQVDPNLTVARLSQFDVPGGETACTPIAFMAISALLNGQQLDSDGIENVLLEGTLLYDKMVRSTAEEREWMQALALSLDNDEVDVGNEALHYFNLNEIPENVIDERGLQVVNSGSLTDDAVIPALMGLMQSGPFGVGLTLGAATVAVVYDGTTISLFDSHGWVTEGIGGAFVKKFQDVEAFKAELQKMIDERVLRIVPISKGKLTFEEVMKIRIPKKRGTQQVNVVVFGKKG